MKRTSQLHEFCQCGNQARVPSVDSKVEPVYFFSFFMTENLSFCPVILRPCLAKQAQHRTCEDPGTNAHAPTKALRRTSPEKRALWKLSKIFTLTRQMYKKDLSNDRENSIFRFTSTGRGKVWLENAPSLEKSRAFIAVDHCPALS